jgi:hypothetical protein
MHDEEHYWMDYNKITLWAHVREEMNLWDGDIILEMPSMDDPEIERIYSDYTSGRLDLSITSTSAIIDHYRRELALEERYCFSPRKRKQFQNFLYKLRRRVILLRAAEAALPQRQEEEGDEAPRVETTEDPSIQTNGVSDTTAMATLGDKVPKKGQITGLKQSTTSPCGAMLNFMAFNYEATVQPSGDFHMNSMLFVQMPSGIVAKNPSNNDADVARHPFVAEKLSITVVHSDDLTKTTVKVTIPTSTLPAEEQFIPNMLQKYRQQTASADDRHLEDPLVKFHLFIPHGNNARREKELAAVSITQVRINA